MNTELVNGANTTYIVKNEVEILKKGAERLLFNSDLIKKITVQVLRIGGSVLPDELYGFERLTGRDEIKRIWYLYATKPGELMVEDYYGYINTLADWFANYGTKKEKVAFPQGLMTIKASNKIPL